MLMAPGPPEQGGGRDPHTLPDGLNEPLRQYVERLFAAEDGVLADIRSGHEREGLPSIHISPDEGKLLAVLLLAVGARRVLEIGALGGYSAIWLARALPRGGSVTTIERDPVHAQHARRSYERAGVADRVKLVEGDAGEILPGLEPGFDAVFVDADKESQVSYFHHAMRLLRKGGLLLGDNAFFHGRVLDLADDQPDVRAIREFNRLAAVDSRLAATIIPVRDGLVLGVKTGD